MRSFQKNSSFALILATFGLGLFSTTAAAQTYVFGTASYAAPGLTTTSPPTGNVPFLTADFNGDGIPDLAVLGANSAGTQVISIFLGKSNGTFAARVDYAVQASGFTVGDFNGDGKLDIVTVSNVYLPVANILFGNGDGTFQAPVALNQSIANGTYSAVASADFNGDGKRDLLFLSPNSGTAAPTLVLLGTGDGAFESPVSYSFPVSPYFAIGDFNGDGKPDIAIDGPASGESGSVSVLINNGDGTFADPVNYSITGVIEALAVADVNGDGKLDLVAATGGTTAGVSVLLGIGDGTFASPVTYTSTLLSLYATSIAVADFNGDGKLDLALTNSEAPNNAVAILLGNGDGTFQAQALLYSAGLGPTGVIALDMNGDGKPDLAVLGGDSVGTYFSVTVLINQGEGVLPARSTYPVPQYPYSAVTGDFNGDGKPDIAVDSFNSPGSVSVLLGNGDGTFQAHLDTAVATYPTAMAAGDFNNDGKLDLVVSAAPTSSTFGFFTLLGNGEGTFQNTLSQTTSSVVRSLAVGDFNKDGKLDVAAVIDGTNAVSIFLGKGDGTFNAPVQYATGPMVNSPPYHNVLAADFNVDGNLDLAVSTDAGISILLGKGDGTFMPYSAILAGESLLAIGDFNGDGNPDLAVASGSMLVSVALGNGMGSFQQASGFQLPSILNAESTVAGDFNGDGKTDLAFANQSTNVVTILLGNGDGTFSSHIEYESGNVSNDVGFVVPNDFNGDGVLDLALADFNDNTVSVFLNSSVAAFYPSGLTFGNLPVGVPSAEQSVSMSNPSPVPIALSSIGTTGDFSAANTCGFTLAPVASCQASVTFTPTAGGSRTGLLVFSDSVPGSPQSLPLTGTGTAPTVQVAPSSLAFRSVATGTTSPAKTITLTNTGSGPLAITSVAVSGNFAQTNTCGSSVNAGANCAIMVTFSPKVNGNLTGSITVADDATGSPQTVSLTGTGTGPVVSLSSPPTFSAELVGNTSGSQTVTLTNTGNASLTFSAIGATGPFAVASSGTTCSASAPVAASGTCTVSVIFTPTAGGAATGTLSLTDNAPGSPQTVALSGTGQDFTLAVASGSSSSATVTPGQMATYSLSLGGVGGMSQTINFTCTGAPSEATCAVNPASSAPAASGSVTLTATVTTTAPTMVAPNSRRAPPLGPGRDMRLPIFLLLRLLTLAAFGLRFARPQPLRRTLRWGLVLAALTLLAMAIAACGGGGGGGGGGGNSNPGTPAGTSTVTVTGSTSGSPSVQHSVSLTLNVS